MEWIENRPVQMVKLEVFGEVLEKAMNSYYNGMIYNEKIIVEILEMAK